jgi:hypothetical protein
MSNLEDLQEKIVQDIELYLTDYGDLPEDDIFALKYDIVQIVKDRMEDAQDAA